jgi:hypothetical protein
MKKKIQHAPKQYTKYAKNPFIFVNDFNVYAGSIYGRCIDGTGTTVYWVCDNYATTNNKLYIHYCTDRRNNWELIRISPAHPCYKLVKTMLQKLDKIPYIDKDNLNEKTITHMMKHYSRKKKSQGTRINTNQINQPLRWNEVTEEAHWACQGNCSVVANAIRYDR